MTKVEQHSESKAKKPQKRDQPQDSTQKTYNPLMVESRIVETLRTCYDPEIPVNIYDLGLIYEVKCQDPENVIIVMTLTTPNCPAAESIPEEVKMKVQSVEGVKKADVDLVWEPPWTMENLSEAAKLKLGLI